MPSDFDAGKFLVERGWRPEIAKDDFAVGCRILEAVRKSNKGLILSGNYGSGKTTFAKAAFGYKLFVLPGDEWALSDRHDYTDVTLHGNVILDDVGCEHTQSTYGVKTEAFADYIVNRYVQNRNGKLIITTNLNTTEFERRYGGRVVSRLKEMCFAARFSGGDKREWEIIK